MTERKEALKRLAAFLSQQDNHDWQQHPSPMQARRQLAYETEAAKILGFVEYQKIDFKWAPEVPKKPTIKGDDWITEIKRLLKVELRRRNLRYEDLIENLATIGVEVTQQNLRNKISRGSFSAVFFVQCLYAIGCTTLHLEDK